jgi:hypothetical protein
MPSGNTFFVGSCGGSDAVRSPSGRGCGALWLVGDGVGLAYTALVPPANVRIGAGDYLNTPGSPYPYVVTGSGNAGVVAIDYYIKVEDTCLITAPLL